MKEFLESFSNREIAIILWISVAIIIAAVISRNIFSLLATLFSKALLPFYLIFIIYFTLIIFWLNSINVWENSLYKDFIFWFFTTAAVTFFKANDVNNWSQLNSMVLHVFSWNMILEFLIDTYNFNLGFEIIFVFVMVIVGIIFAFVSHGSNKNREGFSTIAKILNILIGTTSCVLFFYVIIQLITNYEQILNISSFKSFLFSPIFTLLFSPFIIFTVFFIKYENMFLNLRRYKFLEYKRKLKIKIAILIYSNLNFEYIRNAHDILIWRKSDLKDNKNIFKYLKKEIKSKVEKSIL